MFGFRLLAPCGRQARAREFMCLLTVAMLAGVTFPLFSAVTAEAKTPGKTYCFHKKCHRVKTIAETEALVGKDLTLVASFYDSCKRDRYNPCGLTSSGERFHADRADNAASPDLPDGTIALVWSKSSRQALVIRINNAGPYWGNRKLDLSKAAARKLGIAGVGQVTLRVLKAPTRAEARYSKNRVYQRVPGPIGQFANLDAAQGALGVMVAEGRAGTTVLAGLPGLAPATDPAVNVASVLAKPLVPRADLPRGALAAALAAQAETERRILTATAVSSAPAILSTKEASIDARPVAVPRDTPEVALARGAIRAEPAPRRAIRTAEVAVSKAETKSAAGATAAEPAPRAKIRSANAQKPRTAKKRVAKVKAKTKSKAKVQAKPTTKTATKPAAQRKNAQAKDTGEIHVGFTTYAEKRFQKKNVAALSSKLKKKSVSSGKAKANAATVAGSAAGNTAKRAGLTKNGKSAALKKAGGWQSSAVIEPADRTVPRPRLTGSHPSVPAGELRDETETPPRPGRRVHPSALV